MFTILGNHYAYVIVRDKFSGKKNRYTTHAIALFGLKRTKIIGRELTLSKSRKVIEQHRWKSQDNR